MLPSLQRVVAALKVPPTGASGKDSAQEHALLPVETRVDPADLEKLPQSLRRLVESERDRVGREAVDAAHAGLGLLPPPQPGNQLHPPPDLADDAAHPSLDVVVEVLASLWARIAPSSHAYYWSQLLLGVLGALEAQQARDTAVQLAGSRRAKPPVEAAAAAVAPPSESDQASGCGVLLFQRAAAAVQEWSGCAVPTMLAVNLGDRLARPDTVHAPGECTLPVPAVVDHAVFWVRVVRALLSRLLVADPRDGTASEGVSGADRTESSSAPAAELCLVGLLITRHILRWTLEYLDACCGIGGGGSPAQRMVAALHTSTPQQAHAAGGNLIRAASFTVAAGAALAVSSTWLLIQFVEEEVAPSAVTVLSTCGADGNPLPVQELIAACLLDEFSRGSASEAREASWQRLVHRFAGHRAMVTRPAEAEPADVEWQSRTAAQHRLQHYLEVLSVTLSLPMQFEVRELLIESLPSDYHLRRGADELVQRELNRESLASGARGATPAEKHHLFEALEETVEAIAGIVALLLPVGRVAASGSDPRYLSHAVRSCLTEVVAVDIPRSSTAARWYHLITALTTGLTEDAVRPIVEQLLDKPPAVFAALSKHLYQPAAGGGDGGAARSELAAALSGKSCDSVLCAIVSRIVARPLGPTCRGSCPALQTLARL